MFGELSTDIDGWSKPLIESGLTEYIDAVALHRYGVSYRAENPVHLPEDDIVTSEIKKIRELLDANGGENKPIWLTETGYTTTINKYGVSEYEQAKYLPRLLLNFISEGAQKVFWYDLLDDGVTDYADKGATHEYHFGLLRSKLNEMGGYSPKPAYVTYGVLTRALDGKFFSEKQIKDENIYRYIFRNDNSETSALCAVSNTEVTLKADNKLTVTDIMGRKSELIPENGEITFILTGEMIYIDGEFSL